MIFGWSLLLFSIVHHAASTLLSLDPTTVNGTGFQCFTPDAGHEIEEVELKDCRNALLVLARAPSFTTPMTYSKNPGGCLILVSCYNDRDAYTFRLADVLAVAKKLVDTCVESTVTEKWGLLRWGGLDDLGDSETFFVSVFRPTNSVLTGSVGLVEFVNDTLLHPGIKVSRANL